MKKLLLYITVIFAALSFTSCNPLSLDEPLPLAADFSDPVYPKTYGRVSVEVSVDPNAKPSDNNLSTKAGDMKVQFYYIVPGKSKAAPGTHILCAEFARWSDMPAVTLFPEGDYLVVASSQASSTGEYLIGKTYMTVSKDGSGMGTIKCELMAGDFSASHFPSTFGNLSFELTFSSQSPVFTGSEVNKPVLSDMPVRIYFVKADGDTVLAKYYEKSSIVPPIALFPVGKYIVASASHQTMPEVCDYAFFSDTVRTEVVENGAVQAGLDLKMRNTYLAMKQSAALEVAFKSWNADFIFKGADKPAISFPASNKKALFITPKPFEVRFSGVQSADDKVYTQNFAYSDVKADTKIEINLTGNATGNAVVELYVNGKIVQKDHNVSFPDDDDELDSGGQKPDAGEDPDPKPDPKPVPPAVTGVGFDINKTVTLSKSKDFNGETFLRELKAIVTAEAGIQEFVIAINSPDLPDDLLIGIFGDTKFDLANVPAGSSLEKQLDLLGILPKGTKVKGTKSFTFDLAPFMGLLPVNTATHNFGLKLVDGKGQKIEKTVKILIVE